MLSSGGEASWTSLAKSPTTFEDWAAGLPKSEAILTMAGVETPGTGPGSGSGGQVDR